MIDVIESIAGNGCQIWQALRLSTAPRWHQSILATISAFVDTAVA
jgi:hypothetical protein